MTAAPRMTVEIWSDVICPFCYIGKRKFEAALAQLPQQRDSIDIVWRSFQLQPDTQTDPTRNAVQNLTEKKGWTLDATRSAIAVRAAANTIENYVLFAAPALEVDQSARLQAAFNASR